MIKEQVIVNPLLLTIIFDHPIPEEYLHLINLKPLFMKKLILGTTALMLFLASCETEPIGQDDLKGVEAKAKIAQSKANNASATLSFEGENAPCAPIQEAELYAGQFNLVGKVTVELSEDETEYTITYSVNPGFCISETHLSVVDMLTSFPMASGNPVPGQFEYKGEHDCESGFS